MPREQPKTRKNRADVAKRVRQGGRTPLTPSTVPRDPDGLPVEYLTLDDLRLYWSRNQKRCIELAHRVGGNISEIANVLGTRRQQLNMLLKEAEGFKGAIEEAREGYGEVLVDKAIVALEEILDDPRHPKRVTAAIWSLKGSEEGRKRGWADRASDLPTVQANIKIEINAPWQTGRRAEPEVVEAEAEAQIVEAEVVQEIEGGDG